MIIEEHFRPICNDCNIRLKHEFHELLSEADKRNQHDVVDIIDKLLLADNLLDPSMDELRPAISSVIDEKRKVEDEEALSLYKHVQNNNIDLQKLEKDNDNSVREYFEKYENLDASLEDEKRKMLNDKSYALKNLHGCFRSKPFPESTAFVRYWLSKLPPMFITSSDSGLPRTEDIKKIKKIRSIIDLYEILYQHLNQAYDIMLTVKKVCDYMQHYHDMLSSGNNINKSMIGLKNHYRSLRKERRGVCEYIDKMRADGMSIAKAAEQYNTENPADPKKYPNDTPQKAVRRLMRRYSRGQNKDPNVMGMKALSKKRQAKRSKRKSKENDKGEITI
jgi:hypothetical protein